MSHIPLSSTPLALLRELCRDLAGVEEGVDGFGHSTFKVGGRSFLIAGMGEDGGAVSLKSDPVTQAAPVQRGPWYRTPYIGQHGWVSPARPPQNPGARSTAFMKRSMVPSAYPRKLGSSAKATTRPRPRG